MLHQTPLLAAMLVVGVVLTVRQAEVVAHQEPDDLFRPTRSVRIITACGMATKR